MTRTAEELRAEGRPEAEVRAYLAAVEETHRRFEEMAAGTDEPPADPLPAARVGSPAWEAQQQARSLLAQDQAQEALRRQRQPEPKVTGYDADAAERRAWAIAQALADSPAERMDSRPGEAMVLPNGVPVMVERKNGLIAGMVPGVIDEQVILPHQWEEFDRQWRVKDRRAGNQLLARRYGAGECVKAGLFTAAEAAELDPAPVPEGRGRKPPYNLVNSVK